SEWRTANKVRPDRIDAKQNAALAGSDFHSLFAIRYSPFASFALPQPTPAVCEQGVDQARLRGQDAAQLMRADAVAGGFVEPAIPALVVARARDRRRVGAARRGHAEVRRRQRRGAAGVAHARLGTAAADGCQRRLFLALNRGTVRRGDVEAAAMLGDDAVEFG